MGFKNVKEIAETPFIVNSFRKSPSAATTNGIWFDLSMSPGNPSPQYYASAPLISTPMSLSEQGGIYHDDGPDDNKKKYLKELMLMTGSANIAPMPFILCDYLMYYPFIEQSTTDEQFLINNTTLPRYTDGEGVQIMAVSVAPCSVGVTFSVKYTNQDGVPDRYTVFSNQNVLSVNGNIITSSLATANSVGPFLTLQYGDRGVRSIESVIMYRVDVGLITLVLVKPIATTQIVSNNAPCEKDFLLNNALSMPEIKKNAYLNLICLPRTTLSGSSIYGIITTMTK